MVLGIGTDIIEITRLANVKQAFVNRVYTPNEISILSVVSVPSVVSPSAPDFFPVPSETMARRTEQLAGLFAAKEAVAKALGCGFGRISPNEIEILREESGRPYVRLFGNAKDLSDVLGVDSVLVSISHCKTYAVAYAIAQRQA